MHRINLHTIKIKLKKKKKISSQSCFILESPKSSIKTEK